MRIPAAMAAVIALLALAAAASLLPVIPVLIAIAVAAGAMAVMALLQPPAQVATHAAPMAEAPAGPSLSQLVDGFGEPVLIVDRQRVAIANAAARAALGRHIVGEDIRLAIRHPAAADHLIGRDRMPPGSAVELAGVGTPERRWSLAVHPLGEERRLVRLTDRTETHAAERMRVDFVANASHELRTPLATLLGFIETLEDAGVAEDAPMRARFLRIMFGEARRMQRLIDDLISLSRIEADRYSQPQGSVDLPALLADVRAATVGNLGTDAERIVTLIDDDIPPVSGDPGQISQLLDNIVGNAIKYGRAGTPVTVALRRAGPGMVRLSVTDEGDGIAAEHLPRLTERFYRVDPGRSRSVGGTGLGLAIVKHIVERHRGRLDIASEPGRGTIVTVLLPARPLPGPAAAPSVGPAGTASS